MPVEPALLDTNILVYALFADSSFHAACRALVDQAFSPEANLFVASQSLAEFYAVVTNPRRVTIPKTSEEALAAIEGFVSLPGLSLLPQPIDIVARWCKLLRRRPVTGGDVFDLQLVATMLAGDIRRLYTFNEADFKPFAEIELLVPTI